MSAISREGCFGIQGGGCALVILSMSIKCKTRRKCFFLKKLQNVSQQPQFKLKKLSKIKEIKGEKSISSYPVCVFSCCELQSSAAGVLSP